MQNVPLGAEEILLRDESPRVVNGKQCNGCAVTGGTDGKVAEMGRFTNYWSAQTSGRDL